MGMVNKIILIGRLTGDPELKYTTNGNAVARMTLAVDRNYKDVDGKKQADFIPIVAWRQLAEIVCKYMTKGKLISVVGTLQIRSYDDKGEKKFIAEVIAEDIKFLEKASSSPGNV